jgi:hypothetical protein
MRIRFCNPIKVLFLGMLCTHAAFSQSTSIEPSFPGLSGATGCTCIFVEDSTIMVSCPDSTTFYAHVIWKRNHVMLARNPYLGIMSFLKRKIGNAEFWDYQKKEFHADPVCDRTFLNQTAFIPADYPLSVNVTDLLLMSLDATVTPTTRVYANCVFPNLETFNEYTIAVKQQILVSRQKDAALAAQASVTQPNFWDEKYGNPRLIGTAKILLSYKFFPGGALHAGFMYTLQRKYRSYSEFVDGTEYHSFQGYYHHDLGYSLALELQPIGFAKLIGEFTTDYGPSVDESFTRTCFAAFGPRFFFPSCVLDVACGAILFRSKYSERNLMPFPIVRFSWFIDRRKG